MIKIGLQMYTVRDECEKDFACTIKKVAEIGYQGLEFAGYYGMDAKELRKVIDDLGIKAVNSHVPLENMKKNLNAEIEYAFMLGMKTIAVPWLPEEYRKDEKTCLETCELVAKFDDTCKKAGMQLTYHNHDFEFKKIGNEYMLDIIVKDAKNIKLELDTFWSSYVHIDTVEYMKKKADRLMYIHLKDMIKDTKPFFAEVGEGCLKIDSFVKTAVGLGIEWAFVEQDICKRPSLESAKISFNNLKKLQLQLFGGLMSW